jgi:hypothetical protein
MDAIRGAIFDRTFPARNKTLSHKRAIPIAPFPRAALSSTRDAAPIATSRHLPCTVRTQPTIADELPSRLPPSTPHAIVPAIHRDK